MIGKKNTMMLVCSGITTSGEYTHYTFSAEVKVFGLGIEDTINFSMSVMRDAKKSPEYSYGKAYKFKFEQL